MEISIDALERAGLAGWRALEEAPLGDWILRAGAGFTGRANSALALGDPGMPPAEAVAKARAWYSERGLPTMIAIPYGTSKPPLDDFLSSEGWTIRPSPATVMIATPGQVARPSVAPPSMEVEFLDEPDDQWLGLYHYRGGDLPSVARRILTSSPWQSFARITDAGRTVAIGRVAGDAAWAGLTAIEVAPSHRRLGLGSVLTAALVHRAGTPVYLQVEDDNAPARALYLGLGFTDHHGYHYRVAPTTLERV